MSFVSCKIFLNQHRQMHFHPQWPLYSEFHLKTGTVIEWNSLDPNKTANIESYSIFKWLQQDSNPQPLRSKTNTQAFSQTGQILKFLSPFLYNIYSCHIPKGIKLVAQLLLGPSLLQEHQLKHSSQNSLNQLSK